MEMPITQAMARLTELLRLVEAGETAVLTRRGKTPADLVPYKIGKAH